MDFDFEFDFNKTLIALTVIPAIALATLNAASKSDLNPIPTRHTFVPSSAQWAGSPQDGNWVDCSGGAVDYNFCTVYDRDGKVLLEGAFQISATRAAKSTELHFLDVKGTRLLLQDGLALDLAPDPSLDTREEFYPAL